MPPTAPSRSAARPARGRRSVPTPFPAAVFALALAIEAALPGRAALAEGPAPPTGPASAGPGDASPARGAARAAGTGATDAAADSGAARGEEAPIRPADTAGLPSREEMTGWHRGYEPRAAPVREALVAVLRARHEPRPSRWEVGVRRSCSRLARELARFGEGVEEGEVFPVPYRPADYHLKRSYASLDEAARACLAGRYGAMEAAIRRSLGSLGQAETVLWRRYRLKP